MAGKPWRRSRTDLAAPEGGRRGEEAGRVLLADEGALDSVWASLKSVATLARDRILPQAQALRRSGSRYLPAVASALLPPFLPPAIMFPSRALSDEKKDAQADTRSIGDSSDDSGDDNKLLEIGYVPSFKREFSNIATVRIAHGPLNQTY